MLKIFAVATSAVIAITAPAYSESDQTHLRFASAFGATHLFAIEVWPIIISKMEELTEGRYTATDYPSGLISPFEARTGIGDGVVDASTIITAYFPSYFAESGIANDVGIYSNNQWAMSSASTEYIVTCVECQNEFKESGSVYLGGGATPPYQIFSRTNEIRTIDDLQGLRIRTIGGPFSAWAESLGMQTVQAPSSEIFEMLSQGTIDLVHSSLPELRNMQLYDVLSSVTMSNFGLNVGDCTPCLRSEVWNDMSEVDRRAMLLAAEYGQAAAVGGWIRLASEAKQEAIEKGIKFIEPDEDLAQQTDEFRRGYMDGVHEALERRGVTNAEEKVERLIALIEKWEDIYESIDTDDTDALVNIRMEEIWDKVDLANYGR